jgi:hypothetical protein
MGRGFVTPVDGAARGLVRPFGNRGFTLTIQGERFVETAGIRLNGRPLRTRFISPTGLEAQVEDDDVDRLGAYAVTVVNPSPGGGESNRLSFTVVENARPTIDRLEGDDLTPASAGSPVGLSIGYRHPAGKPFTLIIRGSGFVETSAVFWAGQRLGPLRRRRPAEATSTTSRSVGAAPSWSRS